MADQARTQTDQILKKMEKKIFNIYSESADDITKKWYAYMKSHEPKVRAAYEELQDALKSGEYKAIKEAKDVYERTMKNVTLNNDKYKAMLNETTARLSHVNEIALDYINGNLPKVYTLNYNEFANQEISGYAFTLVNEQAVKNLATKNKSLLPSKKLDIPKDKRWNVKNINSQVLQGILQGESIPKIANRLQNVTDMNRNSAIRNARTMTTSAENKGRLDSFKKAQDDGVIMSQMWIATRGNRTRDWHADLDGKEVKIGEPWENDYGKIMYPGDPSAHPANVYNCRCAIRAVVKGFKWNREEQSRYVPVEGKDITDTWERRKDQFDFEIEDIINAQGFDGLPRVVSADEFDKYVQESNFIAQRTYSAPNPEILEAYRDQLYNGKWYVDCSTGGSIYGKGMYTASVNDTSLSDSIVKAMNSYSSGYEKKWVSDDLLSRLNKERFEEGDRLYSIGKIEDAQKIYDMNTIDFGKRYHPDLMPASAVETLTLSPDAKTITFMDLKQKMIDEGLGKADAGSYAALKGYDAIIAKGAGGAYGRDLDYTVVLNRTKVIIKGEKQ